MFKNLRNTLLICAFVVVFAAFMGCSGGSSNYVPPPAPEDADVTGFWYMELGMEGDDFPLTVSVMDDEPDDEGMFNLIIEFPIEQDEDGSFSYTGPITLMGVEELYATIEGQVDVNSVTATATVEGWFTMSFTGTVSGNTITGTWTMVEGEGPDITVKGMKMKALNGEEGTDGPFMVVISETPHVPPRVAGAWEIIEQTFDDGEEPALSYYEELPNPLWQFPEDFVDVSQEGWIFNGFVDAFDLDFFGVVYLNGTVLLQGWGYGCYFEFAGTLEGDILTGTFEIGDDDYGEFSVMNGGGETVTGSMTIKIHPKPYWHVISNTQAADTFNVFAWDRELGEMPEEVADALAAHPGADDVWLPIYPEAGVDLGYLLPAADGNHYAWWGSDTTGTYEYFGHASTSSFMSGWIKLPATGGPGPTILPPPEPEANMFLDLDYWYEIESVAPWAFDELFVMVMVQNEWGGWDFADQFELTPQSAGGIFDVREGFSSPNGLDYTPEWTHATLPLNPDLAGKIIRVVLYSRTGDGLFNEFRGHAVDNVTITVDGEIVFFDGFENGSWRTGSGEWFDFETDSMSLQSVVPEIPADVLQQRSTLQ